MRHAGYPNAPAAGPERTLVALQDLALLAGLTTGELYELATRCVSSTVAAHQPVFEEGEPSEGLWVITSGRVRLHHLMADGRRHVVGFHAPTTALDLSSGLDGQPYSATATALEDAELVLIPRDVLAELGRYYPVVLRNALDLLCREVRQRDIATAIAALADARGRIGCTLIQLACQFGVPHGDAVRIGYRLTRQDIADRAGVTVETAIRVISDLQQRGVIHTEAQVIDLLEVGYIREMIGCDDCQFRCSVFAPVGPLSRTCP